MKKIAILQSNYIPWKGYFDLINMVDEFVIYDDAQYTKNDWRNRNLVQTHDGPTWLTIPVNTTGKLTQRINQAKVLNQIWRQKHWKTIAQSYAKSVYFSEYRDQLEKIYSGNSLFISEINLSFIKLFCEILGITTKISNSSEFDLSGDKTERLLNICRQCSADKYISGPAAKSYFDIELAERRGIQVEWIDYTDYPKYGTTHPKVEFEHKLSILDLLFNEGANATRYMKSFDASI